MNEKEIQNSRENEMEQANSPAEKPEKKNSIKSFVKEYILPVALEAFAVYLFLQYAAFITIVPTGSMEPTVNSRSAVIATRMYAPEKTVRRGDIIIFNSDELGQILFKRCIGLPGEFVEIMENGEIFINSAPLKEPYVKNQVRNQEYQSFMIPEGHYLFLGDNRSGSFDAREWEEPYISSDEFIGEARFTIWPLKDIGVLH